MTCHCKRMTPEDCATIVRCLGVSEKELRAAEDDHWATEHVAMPPRYDRNPKVRERQFADHVEPPVPLTLVWPSVSWLVFPPVASIDVHTETQTT